MKQKMILIILIGQTMIGLFHLGIGIENFRILHIFDSESTMIFTLSLLSWYVWYSTQKHASLITLFEQALLAGASAWLYHGTWESYWEIFLIIYLSICLAGYMILRSIEVGKMTKLHLSFTFIPDELWSIGLLLTSINTLTLPFLLVLTHQPLSLVWIFFAIQWFFLWKK